VAAMLGWLLAAAAGPLAPLLPPLLQVLLLLVFLASGEDGGAGEVRSMDVRLGGRL